MVPLEAFYSVILLFHVNLENLLELLLLMMVPSDCLLLVLLGSVLLLLLLHFYV